MGQDIAIDRSTVGTLIASIWIGLALALTSVLFIVVAVILWPVSLLLRLRVVLVML